MSAIVPAPEPGSEHGRLRVLHVTTSDASGGAGRAAHRLHRGLRAAGVASSMLVREKRTADDDVHLPASAAARVLAQHRAYLDYLFPLLYRQRRPALFDTAAMPDGLPREMRALAPHVVHLHWVGEGFVRPETLKRVGIPLVWTLHDSAPFTGGCHVPGECVAYTDRCGRCPVLGSTSPLDLSRLTLWRKDRAWRSVEITAIAPSRWMAERAQRSSLFRGRRVEVIPNGIDTAVYRPRGQAASRDALSLPRDGALVLFSALGGAADPNKGFALLAEALHALATRTPRATALVVAGARSVPGADALPLPVHCVGPLADDVTMALLLSAVDLMVVPSRLESFSYAALEAQACGCPVVGFRQGGLIDLVNEGENGLLAEPYEPRALADAIAWALAEPARWRALSSAARAAAEGRYSLSTQATRHIALYEELLRSKTELVRVPVTS